MHLSPVGIGTTFLVMGFMEGYFKPVSITFFKYRLFPYTGKVLQALDPIMPTSIRNKTGEELQALILDKVVEQTQDESWRTNPFKRKIAIKQYEKNYSPVVNADHLD